MAEALPSECLRSNSNFYSVKCFQLLRNRRLSSRAKPFKLKLPEVRLPDKAHTISQPCRFGVTNPSYAYNAYERFSLDEEAQADKRRFGSLAEDGWGKRERELNGLIFDLGWCGEVCDGWA